MVEFTNCTGVHAPFLFFNRETHHFFTMSLRTPKFFAVIPGGQSLSIPENQITQDPNEGTGFTWTPSLSGGTTLILTGGDDRGDGTAGSWQTVVSQGINNNSSCLTNSTSSSVPGNPVGGSFPTDIGFVISSNHWIV